MKKIVIDARELRTSTGRYIERLLYYLQQVDHKNQYTVLLYLKDIDGWQPTNKNFTKVACPYKEFTFGEQLGMTWQLYRLKADLVHFGMTQQPLLYFKKSVTTIHDLTTIRFTNPDKNPIIFWIKQQIYKVIIRYAAHKSKHVIVPTRYVKDDLCNYAHINPDKVVVTYESADKITDNPEPVVQLIDKKFIMYVGRPTPHKNLARLIDAYQQIHKNKPELYLALAGKLDNNFRFMQQKAQQAGLTQVLFTGFVSDGQLRWMYEHAAAYVFPSLSEGFGLPGLEAMHYNVPVISSDATCLPEVYGDAAIYFDPLSIDDMAQKIEQLLANENLQKDLAAKGQAQLTNYSWKRMAEQTLETYNKAF